MRPINSSSVLSFCLFLVCGMSIVFPVHADKLSTQELVTKHLASIGSPEDIAASQHANSNRIDAGRDCV
jgi:hypothetical protein